MTEEEQAMTGKEIVNLIQKLREKGIVDAPLK